MVQPTPAAILENLSRLSSKPGVQSTLILSRSDGSIIRSTGLLAASSPSPAHDTLVGNGTSPNGSTESMSVPRNEVDYSGNLDVDTKFNSAENVARMVFQFVSGANVFADAMDKSDEVKLLRLRTRKSEVVIVPDLKYLLVVIHDTPLA